MVSPFVTVNGDDVNAPPFFANSPLSHDADTDTPAPRPAIVVASDVITVDVATPVLPGIQNNVGVVSLAVVTENGCDTVPTVNEALVTEVCVAAAFTLTRI
jgi:hypothetical protein